MKSYELSVFFDSKDSPLKGYDAKAWEVFMRHSDPLMLKNSELFHGDVAGLLPGAGHMYCIAVRAEDLKVIEHLKLVFAACLDARLAPPHDRLRESDTIQSQHLKFRGHVDSAGRFETVKWSRADHDLCRKTGWPYVPHTYPKHLSNKLLDELEKMSEPGTRMSAPENSTSGPEPYRDGSDARGVLTFWLRTLAKIAVTVIVVGLILLGWLNRGKAFDFLTAKGENFSLRFSLGSDAYHKYKNGFALTRIAKIPHDLDLADLNAVLQDKGYHVLQHNDDSIMDTWVYCSAWSDANERRDPLPQTTVQAFIKINITGQDGRDLWLCQSKAVHSASGTDEENPDLQHVALRKAIQQMDLSCLPDGRSVREFQESNNYAGLREYTQHLMGKHKEEALGKGKALDPDDPAAIELENRLREYLGKQWIVTKHIYMKDNNILAALILNEETGSLNLRLRSGKTNILKNQIERIEPFGEKQFAAEIDKILQPLRKNFEYEWQHALCEELIAETAKKCVAHGAPLPNARVVSIKPNRRTGNLRAEVKTGKSGRFLQNGDKFGGFNVIGVDPDTNIVLLRMSENGDVIKIWPSSCWESGK